MDDGKFIAEGTVDELVAARRSSTPSSWIW